MNAAIRTVVKAATARGHEVVGIRNGYEGLLAGKTIPLGLDGISRFGGTLLHRQSDGTPPSPGSASS